MSKKANPFFVGLFTLSGLALVVAGLVIFGSGKFFADTMRFVLHFEGSVKGLGIGSPVKFRGVNIGSVTDIGVVFTPKDFSFAIPVRIEMDLNRFRAANGELPEDHLGKVEREERVFDLLIDKGLRAELKVESILTGMLFIEIDFHPDTPVVYHSIRGEIRELPTITSKLDQITKTIETIPFEHVIQKATSSLEAIERIVNSPALAGSIQSLERAIEEFRALGTSLNSSIQKLSGSLDETLGETRGLVKEARGKLGPVAEEVSTAAAALRRGSERLEKVLANVEDLTSGGDVLRGDVTKALRELGEAARSMRVLAETLETRPDVLLRGKQP